MKGAEMAINIFLMLCALLVCYVLVAVGYYLGYHRACKHRDCVNCFMNCYKERGRNEEEH